MSVSVIVSLCVKDAFGVYRIYRTSVLESFDSLSEAHSFAEHKKAKGHSVVVRPDYNENDEDGRFFREWRSFDGGDFQQTRWDLDY